MGGRKQYLVSLLAGGGAQCGGQVPLAGARRAWERDVAVVDQLGPLGRGLFRRADAGWIVEVEALASFSSGQPDCEGRGVRMR